MEKDEIISEILSNDKLKSFFGCLKTNNWKALDEDKKGAFFEKFNTILLEVINIDEVELIIGNGELDSSSFLNEIDYKNVYLNYQGQLVINDVNYNQYLTMYEYLYKIRIYMLEMFYLGEYDGNFSEEVIEQINKNYRNISYGEFSLKLDKEEGDLYEEYQFLNINAKEFAQVIMFNVVKNNYDFNCGFDEEYFMSNCNILISEYIEKIGKDNLNEHIVDMCDQINKLEKMKNKVEALKRNDLSAMSDKDLFFIVYPKVIKNSDPVLVIKAFNEIIRRIYGDKFKIEWGKKDLYINGNVYSFNSLPNLLNIILYECLNDMDKEMRERIELFNDGLEDSIIDYKKKWLYAVICKIDSSNNGEDFGVFGYQSIYRLLNKKALYKAIKKSKGNYLPLRKRGGR